MTTRPGYALPMTLAAIVVISIVAAIAAEQVQSSTRTISALADQMRARAGIVAAEQTLIYELLTEPMTQQGVAVGMQSDSLNMFLGNNPDTPTESIIYANGNAYRYGRTNPVITRIFDDQSFFNATSSDPGYLSDVLSAYGVPRTQHARMTAALRDYQDEDDLRTLGGAEASDYDLTGLPSNEPLRDALELCSVMYWSETALCEDPGRLLLTFRNRAADRLSPALASEAMLSVLMPDADRSTIAETFRLYRNRQLSAFSQINHDELDQIRDPLSIITLPGPHLTLVTHTPDAQVIQRTVIELTPNSLNSPFVVHSKYAIGGAYSQNILRIESIDDVAPLPQTPAIAAER